MGPTRWQMPIYADWFKPILVASGTLVYTKVCWGDGGPTQCSENLHDLFGKELWAAAKQIYYVDWSSALSDGSAILVLWGKSGQEVVHVSPAGVVSQKPYFFPASFKVNIAVADDKGGSLRVGHCDLPTEPSHTAMIRCATLRNADDSEAWSVALMADATQSYGSEFLAASPTPTGWILAGRRGIHAALLWLDNDGTVAAELIAPDDPSPPVGTSQAYWSIWPWADGWLVEHYGGFQRLAKDGNVLGPLALPDDVSSFTPTVLDDGDLLLSGTWQGVTTGLWGPKICENPRLVRIAPNGERRWERKWLSAYCYKANSSVTSLSSAHNMLVLLMHASDFGWNFSGGWKFEADELQRIDAFGNSDIFDAIGCAGRPISDCDDKDPCTADGCKVGSCIHSTWSDGIACPGGICTKGACVGKP